MHPPREPRLKLRCLPNLFTRLTIVYENGAIGDHVRGAPPVRVLRDFGACRSIVASMVVAAFTGNGELACHFRDSSTW